MDHEAHGSNEIMSKHTKLELDIMWGFVHMARKVQMTFSMLDGQVQVRWKMTSLRLPRVSCPLKTLGTRLIRGVCPQSLRCT